MLAQQDLVEPNIGRSEVLNALENRCGSPYKEAICRGEIPPLPWHQSTLTDPPSFVDIQEFTSSSGSGESSGDCTPDFLTSEEQHPREEDESSHDLCTSTQGSNAKETSTTIETTPKSALNKAEMVEIPQQVPTRSKSFALRPRREPQGFSASQGSCGVLLPLGVASAPPWKAGSECSALQSWGSPARLRVEQAPLGGFVPL